MELKDSYNYKGLQIGRVSFAVCFCMFTVSGCGVMNSSKSTFEKGSSDVRKEKLVKDISINDIRKISKPSSSSEGFSSDEPITTIGSEISPPPNMAIKNERQVFSSKGLKVGELFESNIKDDDARIDRLEGSVQNMHDYLLSMGPSVERLVAVEGDIQNLVNQLETLLDEEPQANVRSSASQSSYKAPKAKSRPVVKAPKVNNFGPKVIASGRASASSSKTRLVFDLSEKMNFSHDLDKGERVLTLFFPQALSSAISTSSLSRQKLFNDVTVTKQGDEGYIVAISLSRDVDVVNQGKIPPNRDNPMYRIYLDLK